MKKIVISLLLIAANLLMISAQERDLDFYLDQAKENSPLIYQAKNDSRIVALDLQQMNRILFKPEINVNSGFIFSPIISRDNNINGFHLVSDGATDYIGHDLASTDGGQYQALLSLRQSLLSGSKYKAYENQADISRQINENNIVLTIHDLEQLVSYQYLLCSKSIKEAEISLALIGSLEEQYQLLQKLVDHGIYKQTDLMLMHIEMENYSLEYKLYQAEYISNLYDLNLICGIPDTATFLLPDIDLEIGTDITVNSGFLAGFKLDSLSILSDQAVNELKYKPQLDLFADAGLNATFLPYPQRFGISAGVVFTWNIFDGNQRSIQHEKSMVNLQTLEFRKNNFITQNEISKNKILKQIKSVNERLILNEKQVKAYKQLYESYSKELSLGEASVMDFKNLLKDISAKNYELLQLRTEKQFLINSYNYLNF